MPSSCHVSHDIINEERNKKQRECIRLVGGCALFCITKTQKREKKEEEMSNQVKIWASTPYEGISEKIEALVGEKGLEYDVTVMVAEREYIEKLKNINN